MIGSIKVKNIFLRLLPYLISLLSGTLVYILADIHIENVRLNGLVINIAAALLSIPIIFIFYEVINNICVKDIKSSVLEHFSFEVNYIIIDVIKTIRQLLNVSDDLTAESLNDLLQKDRSFILQNLQPNDKTIPAFIACKDKLLKLIYGNDNLEVLTDAKIKNLLIIAKHCGIIAKELEQINVLNNKELIAISVIQLFSGLSGWIELSEEDAIVNHHSFNLV